jgi:hypothetical protein
MICFSQQHTAVQVDVEHKMHCNFLWQEEAAVLAVEGSENPLLQSIAKY